MDAGKPEPETMASAVVVLARVKRVVLHSGDGGYDSKHVKAYELEPVVPRERSDER
jgi:hypothetical protein